VDSFKDSLLRVNNLSAYYPRRGRIFRREFFQAINNISFELSSGECLAIFGKLAAGKSTIMKIILGHIRPLSGDVFFKGYNLFQIRGKKRISLMRKIQPIFQDPFQSLHPTRKIGKQLLDAYKNNMDKDFHNILIKLSIKKDYLDKCPYQLSGGQLQRVCIARALLSEPDVLILDEPFTAQDHFTKIELIRLLNGIRIDYNLSYLLITHDIFTIIAMANRVIQIEDGAIKKHYSIDEFKKDFGSEL